MRPELFHRWYDPRSERVLDFLKDHKLDHLVNYVDIDDEDEMPVSRLNQICGETDVPVLVVDMEAIMGEEKIISWFREHLLGRDREAFL